MASVTLSAVSVRHPGGALGLADVDLRVADGELLALVGPSGSGKTTLLRTIAGFLAPTSGRVLLGDEAVAGGGAVVPPERRGIGMVFQQHAVWPHWDVGRNVAYPLRRARVPRAERAARVAEALEMVGLGGQDRRDPATLSGGQRQRVALARALVSRPRVLLLDEALSALDEPLRDRLRLELHALTRSLGLTVVHVTHDRSEALALADRVAVLDGGRVQQVGTPEELVGRPGSAFVAGFLSDAALVDGTVEDGVFAAARHPLRLPAPGTPVGPARAAVLPADVEVRPAAHGAGVVRSSLFARDGADVVVDWAGLPLRARVTGSRPAVGADVDVDVRAAHVFPADDPARPPAARVAPGARA